MKKTVSLKMGVHKDPNWWLTEAGIKKYNRETGSNLKPWVDRVAKTEEEMMRQWRFFVRFYTNPSWPLVDDKWRPTRLALAAQKRNKPAPKTISEAKKLAEFWRRQIEKAKKKRMKW
jgi:hypothetical protein